MFFSSEAGQALAPHVLDALQAQLARIAVYVHYDCGDSTYLPPLIPDNLLVI
jgi:hypothetical protein